VSLNALNGLLHQKQLRERSNAQNIGVRDYDVRVRPWVLEAGVHGGEVWRSSSGPHIEGWLWDEMHVYVRQVPPCHDLPLFGFMRFASDVSPDNCVWVELTDAGS
jgi:hypothetical protein